MNGNIGPLTAEVLSDEDLCDTGMYTCTGCGDYDTTEEGCPGCGTFPNHKDIKEITVDDIPW